MSARKKANKEKLKTLEMKDAPLRALHVELFPEEYDFHYDSNNDAKLRSHGINPMSDAYQKEVNLRRYSMGVEPYMGSVGVENTKGLISSWAYCQIQIAK